MYTLPSGWSFKKVPVDGVLYSTKRISGFAQHFFYGRFLLTNADYEEERFDTYIRYWAHKSKSDSAIGVVSEDNECNHKWMWKDFPEASDPIYIVSELVRQRFVNDEWWYYLLAGKNVEVLNV